MENNETQEAQTQPEIKEEVTPQGEPTADTGEGKPVEAQSKLEEAKEISKKIDEGNKLLSENITRLEKLKADELLGGRADAGQTAPKPAEQTDQEYAQALMDGKLQLDNDQKN